MYSYNYDDGDGDDGDGDGGGGVENISSRPKEEELLQRGEEKVLVFASQDRFLTSRRLRSENAGFVGILTISALHVNMATISDIGGLKLGYCCMHNKAT